MNFTIDATNIYNIKERGQAKKKLVHVHESREEVFLVRHIACACHGSILTKHTTSCDPMKPPTCSINIP
jgi:hypothetical protein